MSSLRSLTFTTVPQSLGPSCYWCLPFPPYITHGRLRRDDFIGVQEIRKGRSKSENARSRSVAHQAGRRSVPILLLHTELVVRSCPSRMSLISCLFCDKGARRKVRYTSMIWRAIASQPASQPHVPSLFRPSDILNFVEWAIQGSPLTVTLCLK